MNDAYTVKPQPRPPSGRRRALAAATVVGLASLAFLANRTVDPGDILPHYELVRATVDAHFATALLGYMAFYAVAAALALPGAVLITALGGLLFGWFWGALAALLAASSGAILLFVLARSAFGALLTGRASLLVGRIRAGVRENAVFFLLFLRLTPVFPFFLVNLACALVGVPLGLFVATTLVGMAPAALALAAAGSGLDGLILSQKAAYEDCRAHGLAHCRFDLSLQDLATPELLLGLGGLGCLALLPVVLRHLGAVRRARAATGK